MSIQKLKEIAKQIRRDIVLMTGTANTAHSGSALSAVEILTSLYFRHLKIDPRRPEWIERDRFILSKGHASTVLYASLAERGFFDREKLKSFLVNGSPLTGHPSYRNVPGVEATTGSLGHGLALGIGAALAAKKDSLSYRTYVLLSDGECDEGTNWEGILFAGHFKLDNLIVFVDYNKIQSFGRTAEVMDLEPFADKLRAFRWHVQEVNGHSISEIDKAVRKANGVKNKPHCIIAHTTKGKGVSYMENKMEWHYFAPSGDLLKKALDELK